jgi:hypothetical protein
MEAERQLAEVDRKQQENELNRRILERISSADLSDPNQVSAIAQLLAFAPGATTTLPAVVRDQLTVNRPMARVDFDDDDSDSAKNLSTRFTIRSIVGAGGQFTANMENNESRSVVRLRRGSNLEGWSVSNVTRDAVILGRDGEIQTIYMK